MRKLLIILIILWAGVARSAIPPIDKIYVITSSLFPEDSLIRPKSFIPDSIPRVHKNGFTLMPRSTKLYGVVFIVIPEEDSPAETNIQRPVTTVEKRSPALKITGNILYDVNYRSHIDTPYAESNVYQHTIQTRLDLLYKNQYPLKIYFTSRFSNSPLFRNYNDFNIRFNPSDFKRIAQQKVLESAKRWLAEKTGNLDSLYQLIEKKKKTIASLRQSITVPDLKQKIIEEREKDFYSKRPLNARNNVSNIKDAAKDSLRSVLKNNYFDSTIKRTDRVKDKIDSITGRYNNYKDSIEAKKKIIDSLEQELQKLENQYRKIKALGEQNLAGLKKQIEEGKDIGKLADKLQQLNIPDTILPKGYKTLSGIQSLNIGRSIADYSELSVKNISITGVQAEYNTQYYYAIAVGKVDYRFRDYIVPNHTRSNQYVALVRFGKGTRNGNHVFLTYYTGKRQLFNSSVTSQDGSSIPGYNLAGVTIEGVYKINRNIVVIGEIAKSTIPYYSLDSIKRKSWMSSIGKMNTRSNEAYSIKVNSFFPGTQTRFNGYIAYTGADFQSFSIFTTGAAQLRWMARLEQPFFKKQLTIISTAQKNNYTNPFVATAYSSSSLLTSFQVNLRIKKYPFISLGYFPAYQLTKASDNYYSESRYYTLTGSAGYAYRLRQVQLTSYAVYSRFYNAASDSGFVYYNSKNLLLSQSLNFSRFSILVNGSLSTGDGYALRMLENTLQVSVNKVIGLGCGLKMIDYSLLPVMQWGYSGSISLDIPKIGSIQLTADKGFIPGLNKQLSENNTGRLIYYKTF